MVDLVAVAFGGGGEFFFNLGAAVGWLADDAVGDKVTFISGAQTTAVFYRCWQSFHA